MDEEFYKNIEKLLELERESLALNSELLTDLMNRGVKDITKLDHVADQILDVMHFTLPRCFARKKWKGKFHLMDALLSKW